MPKNTQKRGRIAHVNEFKLETLPDSCSLATIGAPKSGKSTMIKYLFWCMRYKYPVSQIYSESEKFNKFFGKFNPDLYVFDSFDKESEALYLDRQRLCINDKKCKLPLAINVLDDCSADRKGYNDPIFGVILKNTTQHGSHMVILGLQSALDFPKQHRKCLSYVFLFNEKNIPERNSMFEQFGGVCGSKKNFNKLMDDICQDHRCMVIKIQGTSNKLEDNVFWMKAPEWIRSKKFEFGCKEYKTWSKKRLEKTKK